MLLDWRGVGLEGKAAEYVQSAQGWGNMIVGKIMNVTQKSSPVAIAAANVYNSCPTARPGGHGMNF